jgi:hypothetical protein
VTEALPPTPARRRPPPRRRGRRTGRVLAILLGGVILFGAGLALGEALHDNPSPGGSLTYVRTLEPEPLAPERETVTVAGTGARR